MNQQLIKKTIEFVQNELSEDKSGHDVHHIMRVYNLALHIGEKEGGDLEIIALTALLHDIKDHKFTGGDSSIGANMAYDFLVKEGLNKDKAHAIQHIIQHMSFKGGLNQHITLSKEGQIVQDADRIDAIGAMGIARTFTYGGNKKRVMYDPTIEPQTFNQVKDYINNQSTTINHFYEKLLKLKDLMNTETGKQIANTRHQFMETFLNQFYAEWEGNDYK